MKAVQFSKKSKSTSPKVCEGIPEPNCEADEVVVKVINSALDTALTAALEGKMIGYLVHSTKEPLCLGWHYSGVVTQVGKDVANGLREGDAVFGFLPYDHGTEQGTLAEYISVKADSCAKKPAKVPHSLAAAASTEGITALQALRDDGKLSNGKSVLIVGGAGGVGAAAIGIAKKLGASNVTVVCSTKDVELVKLLGADDVIDRSKVDPLKAVEKKYDLVFDTPIAYSPTQWFRHLNEGGIYVTTLPSWGLLWGMLASMMFCSKKVAMVECKSNEADLALLGRWLEEGMNIPIDSTFPISEIEAAVQKQKGRKSGRIVIKVDGGW